jgi:hypothetical protein
MILGYFEPELRLSQQELDDFSGYVPSMGAWSTQSMLSFADRGYELVWIEDFDFRKFADDAMSYMNTIFVDPDALTYQLEHSNIPAEQKRANEYFGKNLPFKARTGSPNDMRRLLDEGYLIRLEVNGMPLVNKKGYSGHMVLVIGYDGTDFIIHNPDGIYGDRPNQLVSEELLVKAWKEFGGSMALQALKLKS